MAPTDPDDRLRFRAIGAVLAVVVQAAIGMIVNLDVTIPKHHPGAQPGDFATGSLDSIGWSITHGGAALAVHVVIGLVLLVMVVTVGLAANRSAVPHVALLGWLGALAVLGAAFNGAAFVDFGDNANSLVMALLALVAVASYAGILFQLAGRPSSR